MKYLLILIGIPMVLIGIICSRIREGAPEKFPYDELTECPYHPGEWYSKSLYCDKCKEESNSEGY